MELQFLYLTTTGWKSGKPHEIEIWFVEHQQHYYLCSERREKSHWVQNIQHNPAVTFRVGEDSFHGVGRIVEETEKELIRHLKALMNDKYGWSDGLFVDLIVA